MWPGGSALTSLWGITVRPIDVSLGALTHEECDAFCKELKQNPIDGLCDYGLYGIHVAAATSLKQDTSLPSLSPTLSRNYEQTQVEATGVGEWWPLQIPLSYIYCEGFRELVLINFNTECTLFIQPLYVHYYDLLLFVTYFFIFHSNPFCDSLVYPTPLPLLYNHYVVFKCKIGCFIFNK